MRIVTGEDYNKVHLTRATTFFSAGLSRTEVFAAWLDAPKLTDHEYNFRLRIECD